MSKFSNPFGRLTLTHEDEQRLEAVADLFVHEALLQYQQHVTDERREVDAQRWKFVKQCENVSVYQERPHPGGGTAAYRNMRTGAPAPAADVPILMGVGTITGSLDDVMYGVVAPTQDQIRLRTSYADDHIVDAAVLATIIAPTMCEPFRALIVKWAVKGRPLHVRAVVKNRDLVFLESTGIATLATGERVGYQLLHSVKFTQLRTLDTVVRGNVSMSAIYRQQRDGDSVELYMRGFLDPAGGLMRSIVVKSAAEAMLSVRKYAHCAQMKKLAWVIRRSRFAAPPPESDDNDERVRVRGGCGTCDRHPAAGLPFQATRGCTVCGEPLCKPCRAKKTLSFIAAADKRLVQQRVVFCATCVAKAFNTSAQTVASDEVLAQDALNGLGKSTPSLVSIPSTSSRSNSVDSVECK